MKKTASALLMLAAAGAVHAAGDLERNFANPPAAARPWVWAHWLDGNVTRESITTDLAAMKRVGLGGLCMFDVGQGTPPGPHAYLDDGFLQLFAHEVAEARRLGLEMMAHAGPGWCGNGGPWITPENAMQTIVFSETRAEGGKPFSGLLPQPTNNGSFYRDVAVLAVNETPAQAKFRIENFDLKRVVWLKWIRYTGTQSALPDAQVAPAVCVARTNIVNLTGRMTGEGRLDWEAPPGNWTILRFGHTWTGQKTLPAPRGGEGPECDKLDKRGIRAHFELGLDKLIGSAGADAGQTLHTLFVDSWEAGGQNWTVRMREEFQKRRGYDIIPFLPVLAGRVLDDLQTTERFLYDLRQTVSELATENFWAEFQRLAHARRMKLSVEAYITTGNDLDAANFSDELAGEFWTPGGRYEDSVKSMASVANLNNQTIVGAEAFTSDGAEQWRLHPATVKALGDRMFCLGANRYLIHRYAMQRFPDLKPGITMGPWGLHYERTQTWWEWSGPWHEYLARCQFLLRQGRPVRDVMYAVPEEPLWRFLVKPMPGYDYDACGPDMFRRVEFRDGRVGLPGGPSYALLWVRHTGTMTLERLKRLQQLVEAGANLLGDPPLATPGLAQRAAADAELKAIVARLWGTAQEQDRRVGKGRVLRGLTPDEAMRRIGVHPDFAGPPELSWIHRKDGDRDLYFVANPTNRPLAAACTFRISGRRAERWDPETGSIEPLAGAPTADGRSEVSLSLGPVGSAFVVFRPGPPAPAAEPATERELLRVAGPWTLQFPADSGVTEPLVLTELASWIQHTNDAIRHFSGTASYRTTFTPPATQGRLVLDLGRVEVMARVAVNGRDLGILWKPPYRVDITDAVRAGTNELQVSVVSLWVNRLIGDAALPEDGDRNEKGILNAWPPWVLEGKPSPTGRRTFATQCLLKKTDPLLDSGLLGPVRLLEVSGARPALGGETR